MPAMTYCSTVFSVIRAGLKPVLVDIEKDKSTMCLEDLKKISKKTKLIIPVHLYGDVVDCLKIKKIIKNKNIYIIEDASQSHGAYEQSELLDYKKIRLDRWEILDVLVCIQEKSWCLWRCRNYYHK